MYDISPEELKDYKAYTIVDIRDSMSYAYGHLPDAISVPQAELSTYIDEWKDAGKILIYCKRGSAHRPDQRHSQALRAGVGGHRPV